jgi:hypothetical protein
MVAHLQTTQGIIAHAPKDNAALLIYIASCAVYVYLMSQSTSMRTVDVYGSS